MSRRTRYLPSRAAAYLLALIAVLLLCTAALGGQALYRDFAGHSGGSSSQCALPVSQRTGGWTC
jgi:hypothetical protein